MRPKEVALLRARFTDQTELCWVLRTAYVILEADLGDWKTGNFKQLAVFVQNESDWDLTKGFHAIWQRKSEHKGG